MRRSPSPSSIRCAPRRSRERVHAVDGTPADCVNLALVKLLAAAARPRRLRHQPRRQPWRRRLLFGHGGGGARGHVLRRALRLRSRWRPGPTPTSPRRPHSRFGSPRWSSSKGLPERTLLNVNVPPGRPQGVAVTVQGRREHEGTILEGLDPRRRTYYWIEEGRDDWLSDEMSDIHAVRSGLISVTPLQTDATDHVALGRCPAWERDLRPEGRRRPTGTCRGRWRRTPRSVGDKRGVLRLGAWLSLARALGSGPRGRRFESSRPDHHRFSNLCDDLRASKEAPFFVLGSHRDRKRLRVSSRLFRGVSGRAIEPHAPTAPRPSVAWCLAWGPIRFGRSVTSLWLSSTNNSYGSCAGTTTTTDCLATPRRCPDSATKLAGSGGSGSTAAPTKPA